MKNIIDGIGDSYTKLLLLLSEAGEFVYDGMQVFFNSVFYMSVGELLDSLHHIPIIGTAADILQLILGVFAKEVLEEVSLFQLMIGPLCVMVVAFTIIRWLKDLT